jgi:hypothetical protein
LARLISLFPLFTVLAAEAAQRLSHFQQNLRLLGELFFDLEQT